MNFRFADRQGSVETVVGLSRSMHNYTEENVNQLIRSKYITDNFDAAEIQRYVDLLCKPDAFNIYLQS